MAYLAGQTPTLTAEFRLSAGGVLVDVTGLTVGITAVLGGAVALAPTSTGIVHPATGSYAYPWPIPALLTAGAYLVTWSGTYSGSPVTATEVVTVAAPSGILTLDGAKDQLNKSKLRDVSDDELQVYVDAVNEWFADECGISSPRSVTETVTADPYGVLWLSVRPVLSITSAGSSDVTGWTSPVPLVGKVTPGTGTFLSGDYTVTYVAGRDPIPARLQLAARMLVAHLWDTQRVGGNNTPSVAGYAIPNRVLELAEQYLLPDGIA